MTTHSFKLRHEFSINSGAFEALFDTLTILISNNTLFLTEKEKKIDMDERFEIHTQCGGG